jgi:hypothetical protein
MPPVGSSVKDRLIGFLPAERSIAARAGLTVFLHAAALGLMAWSETTAVGKAAFLLAWGFVNCFWLALLRRPAAAAALSLAMFTVLVLLSRFKHDVLFMTVNFIDVMIIDNDTFGFLMAVFPGLGLTVGLAALMAAAILVLLWRLDPLRVRFRTASLGGFTCLAVLTAVSFAAPHDREEEFWNENYVSKFARSGAVAVTELVIRGLLESDIAVSERLSAGAAAECRAEGRPHIIMILDESSFDASIVPGLKAPPDYRGNFLSFDGGMRSLVVEGAGGPTWYTEYNVLAGLSARSYGRFAEFVTRVAAGRVERGLPQALRRCGYRTFSLYPWLGAFLGARSFQTAIGIDHFLDAKDLGTTAVQPDRFYFDAAARLIAREHRGGGPLFFFVYTMANHFPWSYRFAPDRLPQWRDPGNSPEVDEYLRRQALSAEDYAQFRARLAREFPGERFLIVRFGDHQPLFAKHVIDPTLDAGELGRRIAAFDPSYFTTYYAIDAVNFAPVDLSLAIDSLDAPYLPLVVLEAGGLPLDPSFAEQKKILERCKGLFYRCAGGAEARRFNRLLIDAGLIKG